MSPSEEDLDEAARYIREILEALTVLEPIPPQVKVEK